MGLLIGMDEAGYGPNLGPLVVTVTAWDVPGHPRECDPWSEFSEVLTNSPARGDGRLHVGDSKQVYQAGKGIGPLERSVLAALGMSAEPPQSFRELLCRLATTPVDACDPMEPWFEDGDLPLPIAAVCEETIASASRWRDTCESTGIRLRAIRSDVVFTPRFNRAVSDAGSKGVALSRISLRLLRSVWNPEDETPTLVLADKHGGRNRYNELLEEVIDGQMLFRREEGAERSEYRIGRTDIRFETRSERHFPVALASMVSKYVREAAMDLFNAWWERHVPGLKPTRGYPEDARRFRKDIAPAVSALGIAESIYWRDK